MLFPHHAVYSTRHMELILIMPLLEEKTYTHVLYVHVQSERDSEREGESERGRELDITVDFKDNNNVRKQIVITSERI